MKPEWTATAPLLGGDFPGNDRERARDAFFARYAGIPEATLRPLFRRHGTLADEVLGNARSVADLGEPFGAGLYAREVDYLLAREWARSAEDVLWRRTKAGLELAPAQCEALARYLAGRVR